MNRFMRLVDRWGASPWWREASPIIVLTLLWALYFWRVLTPNPADQVSLPQGDFSGQFVAFGAYQARRLLAGQIPLWNPYSNAGHPFLADTQAAVFYPIRLLTIVISHLTGGWGYNALQIEVISHYWIASVLMYSFLRTATGSRLAGMVSALTVAYGGYLTGYPPLQVAVLEAGVWLPLILLGIYKASANEGSEFPRWRARWLAISGVGLGVSLLAGHPQTSLFITYVVLAYAVHRAVRQHLGWKPSALAVMLILALGYGLAAIQIIPGLEYTGLTTRTDIGFDARANGFPFSDLITILLPNVFTIWSPLYSGIAALVLSGVAIQARQESARFWGVVGVIALGLAFGGATIIYQLAYLGIPGLALFRGQERAAYVTAFAVAILAGLGTKALQSSAGLPPALKRGWRLIVALGWAFAVEILIARIVYPQLNISALVQAAFLLAILLTLNWLVFRVSPMSLADARLWSLALIGLIVLDLFSTTIRTNWEPVPASKRDLLSSLVPVVEADNSLFRVDGRVGLGENYGTLIGLQDIRGTSPLRLKTLQDYLGLPQYRLHQLLAVKYVFTDWTQLEVPSSVIAETTLGNTRAMLHKISDPFPRAWMTYRIMETTDQAQVIGWLSDPGFDPRSTVILPRKPALALPSQPPQNSSVTITKYLPESISADVDTPSDGVLVISEMDYPGWVAMVDGKITNILRADAGLRGVALTKGKHRVDLDYRPVSVTVGAAVSVLALAAMVFMFFTGAIASTRFRTAVK